MGLTDADHYRRIDEVGQSGTLEVHAENPSWYEIYDDPDTFGPGLRETWGTLTGHDARAATGDEGQCDVSRLGESQADSTMDI